MTRVAALIAGLMPAMLCVSPMVVAQQAQRWQEVEVLVFSHEDFALQVSERPLADPAVLQWLPRPALLQKASAGLAFPFADAPADALAGDSPLASGFPADAAVIAPVAFGPQPAAMNARSFRLLDPARDPFVALDPERGLLEQDARRLVNAGGHRLLWHAIWRQPLVPATQSQSVLLQGGEQYGERHELEGSVRVSDSGGRAQLDLHLWFSRFVAGAPVADSNWRLPDLPAMLVMPALPRTDLAADGLLPDEGSAAAATLDRPWTSTSAWQLRDTRLLTEDAYHYLDNPAFGVLVQIRPYQVPPRELAGAEDDF